MTSRLSATPKNICENFLKEIKQYNTDHRLLPAESAVADRLLRRSLEMTAAYEELHSKLQDGPYALKAFLGLVLTVVDLWSPEMIAEARNARRELISVNHKIAQQAAELAELLQRRTDLGNTSDFRTNTNHHVCNVLKASAQRNYKFTHHVQESLNALQMQFGLKYWPTLSDFASELAHDASMAIAQATDPVTAAATAAPRASLADVFKALFESIEENSARNYGPLPTDFQLSDSTYATLMNCALDLDSNSMGDAAYVKRLRQREREGGK